MRTQIRTKLAAGLLATALLLSGCTSASHTDAPSPPAPAAVPSTTPASAITPQPAPRIVVPVQAQSEALLLLQRNFGALAANDLATANSLWSARARQFASKPRPGEKSGITGLRKLECHDFQPVKGDPGALGCNMTVDLITADGQVAGAWGEGPNFRAVKLVQEDGHWAIDAMGSGPPWPQVDDPTAFQFDAEGARRAIIAYFDLAAAGNSQGAWGLIHPLAKKPQPTSDPAAIEREFRAQKAGPKLDKIVSVQEDASKDGWSFKPCNCWMQHPVVAVVETEDHQQRTLHLSKGEDRTYKLYWSSADGLE